MGNDFLTYQLMHNPSHQGTELTVSLISLAVMLVLVYLSRRKNDDN